MPKIIAKFKPNKKYKSLIDLLVDVLPVKDICVIKVGSDGNSITTKTKLQVQINIEEIKKSK